MAISSSCPPSTGEQKPLSYVDTQMANTTRDSVSESTVAPTVTVIGSSRFMPSSATIGDGKEGMRGEQGADDDRRDESIAEHEAHSRA